MLILDPQAPHRTRALAAYLAARGVRGEPALRSAPQHQFAVPRFARCGTQSSLYRPGHLLLIEAILRGDFGREYRLRSEEAIDRFWRCPSIYGILPGKYGLFTSDATSNIGIPQSTSEWSNTGFADVGAPLAIYLCQEASGNLSDSTANGLTLTKTGSGQSYQNTVTGWSTKAINFTDNTLGHYTTTASGLPDISGTSMMGMAYIKQTAVATRSLIEMGTTRCALETTTSGDWHYVAGANVSNSNAAESGPLPIIIQINRTASSETAYTTGFRLVPTFSSTPTGKSLTLGGKSRNPPAMSLLYSTWFSSTNAEMSRETTKNMLAVLNWTIGSAWAAAYTTSLSESISISESLTALQANNVTLSESVSVTESLAAMQANSVALSDSESLSDSLSVQASDNVTLSESESLSDSLDARQDSSETLSDSVTLSDSLDARQDSSSDISDSLSILEDIAIAIADSVTFDDQVALDDALTAGVATLATLSDSTTLAETLATMMTAAAILSDSETLSDSVIVVQGIVAGVLETLSQSDALLASYTASQALTDTETLAEQLASQVASVIGLFEIEFLAESIAATAHEAGDIHATLVAVGRLFGSLVVQGLLGGTLKRANAN